MPSNPCSLPDGGVLMVGAPGAVAAVVALNRRGAFRALRRHGKPIRHDL